MIEEEDENQIKNNDFSNKENIIINIAKYLRKDIGNIPGSKEDDLYYYFSKTEIYNQKGTKLKDNKKLFLILMKIIYDFAKEKNDFILLYFKKIKINIIKIIFNGYISTDIIINSESKKIILDSIKYIIPLFFSNNLYHFVYNKLSKIFRIYNLIENKEILFDKFTRVFDLWKLIFDIKDHNKMNSNYISFIGKNTLYLMNKNNKKYQFNEVDIYIEFEDGINPLNEKNNDFFLVNVFFIDYIPQTLKFEGIINDKDKEKIKNIFIKIKGNSVSCILDRENQFDEINEDKINQIMKFDNSYNFEKIEILKNYIGKIKKIKIRAKFKTEKSPILIYDIIPSFNSKEYEIISNKKEITDIDLFFEENSDITISNKITKDFLFEDIRYYGGMECFIPIIKIIKYFISSFIENEEKIKILNQYLVDIIRYIIKFICLNDTNFENFKKIVIPLLGALAEINHVYEINKKKNELYSHQVFSILFIFIKSSSLPISVKKSYMMITGLDNIDKLNLQYDDLYLDINNLHIISYQWYVTIILMTIEFILIETNNINNIPKKFMEQLFYLKKILIKKNLEKTNVYSFLITTLECINYVTSIKIKNLQNYFIENFFKIDYNLTIPLTMMKIYFNLINFSPFLSKIGYQNNDNLAQKQKENNIFIKNFENFFNTFQKITINLEKNEKKEKNDKKEKNNNIIKQIINNMEYFIANKDYLMKIFPFLSVVNFKTEGELLLSELIDFHKAYHNLIKNIFIFNKYWSDKKLFFEEDKKKKYLKYKFINYYTKNYQKPFIYPNLDYKQNYPSFSNYEIKPDFYIEEENPDEYNFNIDCPEFDDFNIEYEQKILQYIKTKTQMIIYKVCLVKKTHHIKGIIILCNDNYSLLNKILFISYPSKIEKDMPCCNVLTNNPKYNKKKEKICFGAVFSCPEKHKNMKLIIHVKDIRMILKKIYYYKKSAIEIFTNNKSYYFNFTENPDSHRNLVGEKNCTDFTNMFAFFISEFFPIFINQEKDIIIGYSRQFEKTLTNSQKDKNVYDISIGKKYISLLFDHWANNENNIEYSTLDLLLYLNLLSNRSFNDLFQYPVFPTLFFYDKGKDDKYNIIDRKLNTHIGFQTVTEKSKSRKNVVIETYNESKREKKEKEEKEGEEGETNDDDEPSYFKTHYSNNFYVTNFLIRIFPCPFLSIEFQGNGFDSPNRLFYSLEETLYNISFMRSDLREMIPEFFYLPEFLWNINKVNFNKRTNGALVDDVEIPYDLSKIDKDKNNTKGRNSFDLNDDYEKSDYFRSFKLIEKLRNLLESKQTDIISWINIIFGPGQMYRNPKKKDLYFRKESYIDYTDNKEKYFRSYIKDNSYLASVEFGIIPIQTIFDEDLLKNKNKNINYNQSMKDSKEYCKSYIEQIKNQKINEEKKEKETDYSPKYVYQISYSNNNKNIQNRFEIENNQFNNIFFQPALYVNCKYYNNNITIIGYKTGKIEVYKRNKISGEHNLIKVLFAHDDEINHIYYNPRLNAYSTTSKDGYLNVYILPDKLLTSIKNPNGSYFNLSFLSSNPFPSIIAIENETLNIFSYTINGFKIKQANLNALLGLNDVKKDLWISTFFNENGGTYKDRLICLELNSKEKDNLYKCNYLKVPFFENEDKAIDVKMK